MKWKNANRKELPADGEQVLISANGIYYIASFDLAAARFVVQNETDQTTFSTEKHQIYWTELHSSSDHKV